VLPSFDFIVRSALFVKHILPQFAFRKKQFVDYFAFRKKQFRCKFKHNFRNRQEKEENSLFEEQYKRQATHAWIACRTNTN